MGQHNIKPGDRCLIVRPPDLRDVEDHLIGYIGKEVKVRRLYQEPEDPFAMNSKWGNLWEVMAKDGHEFVVAEPFLQKAEPLGSWSDIAILTGWHPKRQLKKADPNAQLVVVSVDEADSILAEVWKDGLSEFLTREISREFRVEPWRRWPLGAAQQKRLPGL